MYQDHKDLLSAFHAHGVKYLVVGGFAVILHAQPRFTKDMDPFIKANPANAQAIYAALAKFAHRSRASAQKTSPNPAICSDLDASRERSIFFPKSQASILIQHGRGALKS